MVLSFEIQGEEMRSAAAAVEMRSECETKADSPKFMGVLMYRKFAQTHTAVGMLSKASADSVECAMCKAAAETPAVVAVQRDRGGHSLQGVRMHS